MIEIIFTVLNILKVTVYYVFLFSWKTGKFITTIGRLLLLRLHEIGEYLLDTAKIILEDFHPFASDIIKYLQAILQVLTIVKCGVLTVLNSAYTFLSAVVNGIVFSVLEMFIQVTNIVASVINGVVDVFAFVKRLLVLFGSGVWFLVTLIPLSLVSCFIYSTYCLGLLFEETMNLVYAFVNKLNNIYEFVTDVPLESCIGLVVGICLVYIFIQFHVVVYQFFRHKFTIFITMAKRSVINFRWSLTLQRETEDNVNEENYCIICQEHVKNILLLPCKHVCLCNYCELKMNRRNYRCPVCRTHVHRTMQVFI